jgi:urease accessory protein
MLAMVATLPTRGESASARPPPLRASAPAFVSTGWQGQLDLEFVTYQGRTWPSRRRHRGPLLVQRPFYPEGREVCHLYLLHPPGGLVGGDELSVDIAVTPRAAALVTTPAAGKVYRTTAAPARQRVTLNVGRGGGLEWLPQETILFEGASLSSSLLVRLSPESHFIGWDAVCFGRVEAGESFERGSYRHCLEIEKGGELVLLEPVAALPGSCVRNASWGFAGRALSATLVASPASEEDEGALASAFERGSSGALAVGFTRLGDVLVMRALCGGATELRGALTRAWEILRPRIFGRPACPPRVWRT